MGPIAKRHLAVHARDPQVLCNHLFIKLFYEISPLPQSFDPKLLQVHWVWRVQVHGISILALGDEDLGPGALNQLGLGYNQGGRCFSLSSKRSLPAWTHLPARRLVFAWNQSCF
uniref:Uncharacterized protein n=1 Tax=Falco tinnunculus TaxID=100819 RepID=A0A8C4U455_FALTI